MANATIIERLSRSASHNGIRLISGVAPGFGTCR